MKTIINSCKRTHGFKLSMALIPCLLFLVFPSCQKEELNQESILDIDGISSLALSQKSKNKKRTVKDVEGNVYKTVKIGNQWWMAENLKTTRYSDGTLIMPPPDPNMPPMPIAPPYVSTFYCWYNNDALTYKDTYGALYNWYAVNPITDGYNICPTGWHVPTDAEWHTLVLFLDPSATSLEFPDYESETAGGLLKEAGIDHWLYPNTGATDQSGFTALPGGIFYGPGKEYFGMNTDGYWWSSTEVVNVGEYADKAYCMYMNYNSESVYKYNNWKQAALSVRCIKDN